jgi:hypothetical protein
VESFQFFSGIPDGGDLCVGGGVMGQRHAVPPSCNDFAVSRDDSPEWPALVRPHFLARQPDGLAHKFSIHLKYGSDFVRNFGK